MTDGFTERARAEAEREYPLSASPVMDRADVLATYRQAAFMWGAEWARRELLAELTGSEAIEVSDELEAEFPQLGLRIADRVLIAHCAMNAVAARRGSA